MTMTCRDLIEFIIDYENGSLPADQLAIFEQHLAKCPPCMRYLETYRKTVDLEKLAFGCGCGCGNTADAQAKQEEKQKFDPIPEALVQAIMAAKRQACGGEPSQQQPQSPGAGNKSH